MYVCIYMYTHTAHRDHGLKPWKSPQNNHLARSRWEWTCLVLPASWPSVADMSTFFFSFLFFEEMQMSMFFFFCEGRWACSNGRVTHIVMEMKRVGRWSSESPPPLHTRIEGEFFNQWCIAVVVPPRFPLACICIVHPHRARHAQPRNRSPKSWPRLFCAPLAGLRAAGQGLAGGGAGACVAAGHS